MTRRPSYLSLTDLFCGAGGASIGAEAAGCTLTLGINHWQTAVDVHARNFPSASHDCRDVSETHPSRYRPTHLLWASPECPTWSQARGRRRNFHGQLGLSEEDEPLPTGAEERSRVTMWDVVRYAEYHAYEAVVVENVVDVVPWSLLPHWYQAMETLGYAHRTLFLNSMFFGAPQSRDRWYTVFWKRGNRPPDLEFRPQAWCPSCEATVEAVQSFKKARRWTDRYGTQYVYLCPRCAAVALPFVTPALAAIDLGVRGERIGDRRKALAPATIARIEAGIRRYWSRPAVFDVQRGPKLRDASAEPLPTQTGRQSLALYIPLVARFRGTEPSQIDWSGRPASEPLGTISAGGIHHGVVGPPLYVKNQGGVDRAGPMAHPVSDPLGTLTTAGNTGLVYVGRAQNRSRPASEPLPTFSTGGNMGLILQAAGNTFERQPGSCRIGPADQRPLWTLPATAQTGLVVPTNGNRHGQGCERVRSVEEPLSTQTADLFRALITSYYGRQDASRPVEEPMGTVTAIPATPSSPPTTAGWSTATSPSPCRPARPRTDTAWWRARRSPSRTATSGCCCRARSGWAWPSRPPTAWRRHASGGWSACTPGRHAAGRHLDLAAGDREPAMTTLIAVYDSDGCVGRCDARCYEAQEPECDCICGGRNHGAGLQRALENTAEMVDPTGELRQRMSAIGGDRMVVQPELPLEAPPCA
jgi:DNA (cytosine-5)-methyltransferase 1